MRGGVRLTAYALIHSQTVANTEHQLGTPGGVPERHKVLQGAAILGTWDAAAAVG